MTHLLVIRLSALGDVAMTVPVINALRQRYPQLKITVLSKTACRTLFEDLEQVNFFSVDTEKKHKGFLGLFRLYIELKKLKVDAIADLHQVIRSMIISTLFRLTGKTVVTIKKGRRERKQLTRIHKKILKPIKPILERHIDVFEQLGLTVSIYPPSFLPKKKLPKNFIKNKSDKWVGIAPFAHFKGKIYPFHLMEKVVDGLASKTEIYFFFFGHGEQEAEALQRLSKQRKNMCVLVEKTYPLSEQLAVISHLDLMLSMDSANGHLAANYGVSVITLWGNTHPYAGFVPYAQPLTNSICPDTKKFPLLPTSIYGNRTVKGYEQVMSSIPPEFVINKIISMIGIEKI